MGNRGTLVSCDAVKSRLPLIEAAFARCGVTCGRVLENDAARPNPELGHFDRILCDVPCSVWASSAKSRMCATRRWTGWKA